MCRILIALIAFCGYIKSDCFNNTTLLNLGFDPLDQTQNLSNWTSNECGKNWLQKHVCIRSFESYKSVVEPFFSYANKVHFLLTNNMTFYFDTLVSSIQKSMSDQKYINGTIRNYLLFPNILIAVKKYFIETKGYCMNSIQAYSSNAQCVLMTNNATNVSDYNSSVYYLNLLQSQMMMRECLHFMRTYCMYILYFNTAYQNNPNHTFFKVFTPAQIGNCSAKLVWCSTDFSNTNCDANYTSAMLSQYYTFGGVANAFEMSQYINEHFGKKNNDSFVPLTMNISFWNWRFAMNPNRASALSIVQFLMISWEKRQWLSIAILIVTFELTLL